MSSEKPTCAVAREKVKPGIWRRRSAKGGWVYEITYRDSDGRQRRQVVPGKMKDAETALAAVKARMGKGERVAPNPTLTFAAAADAWLEAKSPNLTPKTIATYRYALDAHLLPAFGRWRLDKIDVTAVAAYVAKMSTATYRQSAEVRAGREPCATEGYSAQTIKSSLIPLSRTFAYAKRHLGYGGENPVQALDQDERPGYRVHKKKKPKLGRDQLDTLIQHSESPWREMIAFAASMGTRMGETTGVQWRDIDFDRGVVSIERQANAKCELVQLKTETARRQIEAPDWLLSMLAAVKLRSPYCRPEDLVFCTSSGRPHRHGNVLSRGLHAALDRAAIPRTSFHSLRHTHASLWIKDGGDVITLSKRLGHANPQITMTTYADEIEEANDNLRRKAHVNSLFEGTKMAMLGHAPEAQRPPARQTMARASALDYGRGAFSS